MNLQDQVDACVRYLREHGKAIGAAARDGHPLCTRIVGAYRLVHAKAEPHAVALLEDAIAVHRLSRATPGYRVPEDECEHDVVAAAATDGGSRCLDCGAVFYRCPGCSIDGPVWHAQPMCEVT